MKNNKSKFPARYWLSSWLLFLCIGLVGCVNNADSSPADEQEQTVEQTLENLGVDTSESSRLDSDGEALPEDYSPLGASQSLQKFDELLVLGSSMSSTTGTDSLVNVLDLDRKSDESFDTSSLFSLPKSETPWAEAVGDASTTLRVSAGADIDGDGLEELIVVHQAGPSASIELQVFDDQEGGFQSLQTLTLSTLETSFLSIVGGDTNADGFAEVVVAMTVNRSVHVWPLSNNAGVLSLPMASIDLLADFGNSELTHRLDAGQLDYDPSHEFVIVINESFDLSGETGSSRYVVFDDAKNNFSQLDEALVRADAINRTAIVADISLGDIDGDNLDELVFAGLTHFDPNEQCEYSTLLFALDDIEAGLEPLGSTQKTDSIHNGCAKQAGALRFVHVNTGDIDGDGFAEIQANEYIFDDFASSAAFSPLLDALDNLVSLPQGLLYKNSGGFTGTYHVKNADITMADVSANERQEIIVFSQSSGRFEVWGLGDPYDTHIKMEWRRIHTIDIDAHADDASRWPIVTALNVNHDGVAISYDEGEYKLVFTEPVLIAALAAAPCFEALGQNLDACRTTFGTAESSTISMDETLTLSVSSMIGVNSSVSDPISATELASFEAQLKQTVNLSLSHSTSYSYSETVSYTTGPIEDTVIFTTIPFDVYTYSLTSHPDPALIGKQFVVSMPRSPITLQVEREFYNDSVQHGGPQINDNVFAHKAGQPPTYVDRAGKDVLMAKYRSNMPSQWAYDFGPTAVGEGGGSTALDINVATESGFGIGLGVNYEVEIKATVAFVMSGFSIGVGLENTLQIVHGKESIYTGSVANLPSSTFAKNYYQWGLMTYVMDDHPSGQIFEVINYWVE